jgi:hypothetical protein
MTASVPIRVSPLESLDSVGGSIYINLLTLLLNPYPLWHNRPYDEPSMNPRIRRQRGGQT